jgi:hypothetical protein
MGIYPHNGAGPFKEAILLEWLSLDVSTMIR